LSRGKIKKVFLKKGLTNVPGDAIIQSEREKKTRRKGEKENAAY